MQNYFKKSTYFFAVFFVSLLLFLIYHLFSTINQPATPDHTAITLTPFTDSEQKDLTAAQQQEEPSINAGPLVASMDPMDAQARVLNLNRAAKQN